MSFLWKEITLSDKDLIQGYYRKENSRNCEFTFANNFLWAPHYEMKFSIVDGMLIFRSDEATFSVSYPIGGNDPKPVIEQLFVYFKEAGRPFKMHMVSPKQFEKLEQMYPGKFEIEYNRDLADYVYESEKLISLSGKKLHGKRNHINKFKELYPDWSYERMTEENKAECLEMAREWCRLNGCNDDPAKKQEICVTMRAIELRKELGLTGGVLRAGGRVVAFTLGEPGGNDIFVVHIEKAFADVDGAYPMINQQFIEHEAANYQYINREEDTGAEGLRQAKLSYHPVLMLEKGLVTLK